MNSNRIYPSRFKVGDVTSISSDVYSQFGSQISLAHDNQKDCRNCCPRRCLLITSIISLILGAMAAALACGIIFGIPPKQPITRQCKTTSDTDGFLCDDRRTCITSTQMCNGKVDCSNGEDESNLYCEFQCPACSGWRCATVFFSDCDCIPKSRCNDNIQDCNDLSDEKNCTK
uniref:low-density lipoprotein receptor class A domain-containing protein 1-like isoform X2 n=1 Tax=Pristiophorus japonicus TaxID=55135 RepID=UPI00398F09A0